MPEKLTLTITTGARKGEIFPFDEHDTLLFGRTDDCQICLPTDLFVSRHHFILEVNPPDARIRDLGSMHGTYVNGKKYGGRGPEETPEEGARRTYPEVDLHDGDMIKVGQTTMLINTDGQTTVYTGPVFCQYCKKDVSVEAGSNRQGDYMCQSCRQRVTADPGELLQLSPHNSAMLDIQIPDYEIERKLGQGAMGAVYLARHKHDGTLVALKVMLSQRAVDELSRQAFLREIEVTRTLQHPYIVDFRGSGSDGSVFYFLLEYCTGGSIDQLMKQRGSPLSLKEAGPLLLQALEGLAFAHTLGFVHRDLKPHNLLLAGNADSWTAKVADMGLAKNFAQAGYSGMTATGSFAGSFPFTPREQVTRFKYFKPVSDVWAMGATCYYILTGSFPRNHRGQDPLTVILNDQIIPIRQRNPEIPARIAEVIDCALSSNPDNRYQDANQMHKALEKVL